ncbi:hypothetical protein METEAL_12910 [Mesoterricola silvestris]|uniref:Uncharacterized protein n=1 Tax=Mesoterricola silvestris TaxID=2927979 RepID=A0AA48GIW5_9BACT|nr:hypothetical protein METEAL_12910 [Mesoterricola silvestris]
MAFLLASSPLLKAAEAGPVPEPGPFAFRYSGPVGPALAFPCLAGTREAGRPGLLETAGQGLAFPPLPAAPGGPRLPRVTYPGERAWVEALDLVASLSGVFIEPRGRLGPGGAAGSWDRPTADRWYPRIRTSEEPGKQL